MSPPPNRPEIKVLVEDANNNHVVVNLRARAIDSVVQHRSSIEQEDKLTVLDKCAITNTEVVFGLNHYPKLGAASATQTLAKIETSLSKSVDDAVRWYRNQPCHAHRQAGILGVPHTESLLYEAGNKSVRQKSSWEHQFLQQPHNSISRR